MKNNIKRLIGYILGYWCILSQIQYPHGFKEFFGVLIGGLILIFTSTKFK